jgi:leucyl aminopeptidase
MPLTPLPSVALSSSATLRVDAHVVGLRGDERGEYADALTAVGFTGKPESTATIGIDGAPVIVVALPAQPTVHDLRRAAAIGVRAASKAKSVALALGAETPDELAAVAEGARLGAYQFTAYKSGDTERVERLTIRTPHARKKASLDAVAAAEVISDAVAQTRDWTNTPPGDLRPGAFAAAIADAAAAGVKVTIWDESRLERESCGGLVGVGRGSQSPPRLVKLEYRPRDARTHLALVGKGITFDSGGLTIKPFAGMATMKTDMTGAAVVATTVSAVARLGLPVRITAFACLAENMPSGSATRPGDVLTIRNGKTVEVLNTDAEGRLVLADGLSLAVEAKPDCIVDVATLTGACIVGLGVRTTGVLGTGDVPGAVLAAADATGEPMWQLPLAEEMPEIVRSSKVADLAQHNPKPHGGAIYAATFLREFTGDLPWAHLDIAGPSFNEGSPYREVPAGGTGVAVRTLVQLVRDLA